MSLRELEREIVEAVVGWHTLCASDADQEQALDRMSAAAEAYVRAAVQRALDEAEPKGRGPMQHPRGEGRVYRRGTNWWIAYFVDGEEYRQIGGKTEGEARTALAMRIASERAAGVLLGPPAIEAKALRTSAETPEQIKATTLKVRNAAVEGATRSAPDTADREATGATVPSPVVAVARPVVKSHRDKAKMKPCRDCGKPFQPTTAQTRCGACRDRHRLSGVSHHPRVLTNGAKALQFADARCLGCDEPFKSFQGQRHCDKCIKERLLKKGGDL